MRYTVEKKRNCVITVNVTREEMDDFLLAIGGNKKSSILRKMVLDYIDNDKHIREFMNPKKNN